MNAEIKAGIPWGFWAIGAAGLLWYAMGVMNMLMQMNPEMLATYPESHRAIIESQPFWATGGFILSVFGGAIGCILLLLKRAVATPILIASLVGTIIAVAHMFSLRLSLGFWELILIAVMPVIVAGYLVWYSRRATGKGWLR